MITIVVVLVPVAQFNSGGGQHAATTSGASVITANVNPAARMASIINPAEAKQGDTRNSTMNTANIPTGPKGEIFIRTCIFTVLELYEISQWFSYCRTQYPIQISCSLRITRVTHVMLKYYKLIGWCCIIMMQQICSFYMASFVLQVIMRSG